MMRKNRIRMRGWLLVYGLCGLLPVTASGTGDSAGGTIPYRNPALSIDARVEDLLGRMTLEEKVGQMNMPCVYENGLGESDRRENAEASGTSHAGHS